MKRFKKIYIEITNICNLNCSFCSPVTRKKEFITLDNINHIFDEIKDYTDYIYLHVKGEPLLHPELDKIIDLANTHNLKVNITTNGTLLKDKINILVNKPNLNKINISLHSENNKPNYLEEIFEVRDNYLKDKTVIYRLWTLNNGKFDNNSLEIVEKIINHYNLSTDIVDNIYKKNNINIDNNLYIDKDNEFEWPTLNSDVESNGYCFALKTQIAILVDGTVVPCCLDSDGHIPLGNIYKESFKSIIEGDKFITLKKSFEARHPSCELCRKCTFKNKFN
ncbi:MAG: SPASM domain-containing protein [Bacilli bacterium]|nr:SPASM domain-containing protein [Bacilli bacterium]